MTDVQQRNKIGQNAIFIAYYLSRRSEAGLTILGYNNYSEAFNDLGDRLDTKPHSIQNLRDEFDHLFPENGRRGYQRELSPSRKTIARFFEKYSDNELDEVARMFMEGEDVLKELGITGVEGDNMLKDLGELIKTVRENISVNFNAGDVCLSEDFKHAYGSYVRGKGNNVSFNEETAIITTSGNLDIYAPNQWFVLATFAVPLIREIMAYRNKTEQVIDKNISALTDDTGKTADKKNIYKWLKEGTHGSLRAKFETAAYAEFGAEDKDTVDKLYRFVSDYDWWLGGKGIERTNDYYVSPVLRTLSLVNASQGYVADLAYAYATEPALYDSISSIVDDKNLKENKKEFDLNDYQDLIDIPRVQGGQNLIVYGAPGTGKSRTLEDRFGGEPYTRRVVFHPEYSYFDFVGAYKPVPLYDISGEKKLYTEDGQSEKSVPYIDYEFVPGPFTTVLIESWRDPSHMHTLLIEELNRANAASVFGEVFQLMDRNRDGSSEYKISVTDELRSI
jgi:hypothetical protein